MAKRQTSSSRPSQQRDEPSNQRSTINPAKGKLGVMIPGMGAVATTFVAGVEAVRKGLAKPIGSVTQMGTIRLGKRTDGRSPYIKDFVPLAGLNDLVFTGWDPFPDDMYAAARKAGSGSRAEKSPTISMYSARRSSCVRSMDSTSSSIAARTLIVFSLRAASARAKTTSSSWR